ncbi:MAG: DMT family transporter [Proteobacteria bacterium]|nr:DMT family transporter [Pseudomonadota bacterium]
MQHSREGLLAVHAAVLIFGFTALFSKLIALPALDINFYRSVFAFFAIVLFVAYKKQSYLLKRRQDYLMAGLLGVLLAAHWVSYFYAMQVSSVAVGVIALYTYPVITVFLEPLFHGEKPHIVDIVSSFAVLFGIYLIVPEFSLDNDMTIGIIAGVFSAFMMSLRNIMQRRYFSAYPASQALLYQTLIVALVLLLFVENEVAMVTEGQWWQLLVLGIFFTALPHTLFAHGLIHLKAKTASLIACVQVIYASLFAALLLSEIPGLNVIFGGFIVIAVAMIETMPVAVRDRLFFLVRARSGFR